VPWPAHDARRAQIAFPASEIGTLPVPRRAPPQQHFLRAVVTGQDHERVAREAEFVEQIQQRPEVGVESEQAVGPIALAGLAFELHSRDHRHVHQ
jgi:hypothetical protein